MGMFDSIGVSKYAQKLYAWEADFLSGDFMFTDVNMGRERVIPFEKILENIHEDDLEPMRSAVSFISSYERRQINLKIRYFHDGAMQCYEVKGMAFARDDRVLAVGFAYDQRLTECQRKNYEHIENYDALTGLASADALDAYVKDFFSFGMNPQTLIVAKIDKFNEINNSFGYSAGNTLIKNVAEVIKECFFDAEMIARIGGGEFCAVYAGKGQLEIDNKIKQARMMLHGMYMNLIKTDVSFGYAAAEQAMSFSDLYRKALNKMRKNTAISTVLTESTVLDSMNSIIEKKAKWGKRQVRLQSLSSQVAAALGCSEEAINEIKVLAKVADIGLLSVDDRLIENRLNLSGKDLDQYKRHVDFGREMISKVDELADIQELYGNIFKRYDEYEDTLPLASCIVAGVRGFDDIISSGIENLSDITERLMSKSGKEYCPEVVDAIIHVAGKHYVAH
jgi:diguanylate cyclase (GGDEF)-like protein